MLPNLVIIGAMKCGTTSLHQYLDQHPLVSMSRPKELNFFTWNWDKGLAWYEAHFDAKAAVRGESSPTYTRYPDPKDSGAPRRMYSVLPNAKLIYIVRDPIERVISHYLHANFRRREDRPISEALRPFANNRYIDSSRYFLQLEQYLEFYSPSQILVLTTDELRKRPQAVLDKVCEFLEVPFFRPDRPLTANVSEKRGRNNWLGRLTESNTGKRIGRLLPMPVTDFVRGINWRMAEKVERPTLDEDLRRRLADYLREDVARLREYTGERFETWSV